MTDLLLFLTISVYGYYIFHKGIISTSWLWSTDEYVFVLFLTKVHV